MKNAYLFQLASLLLLMIMSGATFAQPDTAAWHQFLRQHSLALHPSDTTNFDDLAPFGKIVEDKKLVLLGEFTHGAKDINVLKARLIRYLHEEKGFKVLLLESGMGELARLPYQREKLSPPQFLAGLIGPWRTDGWLDFMAYAQQQESLLIGGFDVQESGQSFKLFAQESLSKVDTAWATQVVTLEEANNQFVRNIARRFIDSTFFHESAKLIAEYEAQLQLVSKYTAITFPADLFAQTFRNRIHYLQYMTQFRRDKDYRKRWVARDSMMAANVMWFLKRHPNEKVILSAHNFHVAKYNAEEEVMGAFLRQQLGDQMYSVGVFAGQGEYANNSRQPEPIEQPETVDDIRSIILSQSTHTAFLDISDIPQKSVENSWLFEEILVPGFVNLVGGDRLSLRKSFDGLLLLNRVAPPSYPH